MGIFSFLGGGAKVADDMAKTKHRNVEFNEVLVAQGLQRLMSAGLNSADVRHVLDDLVSDHSLRSVDLVAIAHAYIGGGSRPPSKKAAVAAILKRLNERVRAEKKGRLAEKARSW